MARRTINIPDPTDVRELARDGESFSAAVSALIEAGARSVALDGRFADLGLRLADAAVMACAERHDLPVLTFDVAHFRAAPPPAAGS